MSKTVGRVGVLFGLLVLLVVLLPTPNSGAQQQAPQCSDGIDNDGDNAIDGFDKGCGDGRDDDETDSPEAGIIYKVVALPVVTVQGTVAANGTVDATLFEIRAARGTRAEISCSGSGCPVKKTTRTMITTRLRLRDFERKLKPNMTIVMRISRPDQLGKYFKYQVRRNKAPKRTDACLDATTGKLTGCFDE